MRNSPQGLRRTYASKTPYRILWGNMNKLSFHQCTYVLLLAATTGASAIFLLGMVFRGGVIDINALYNQYGWKYGEGWFETIMFISISIIGLVELARMRKNMA